MLHKCIAHAHTATVIFCYRNFIAVWVCVADSWINSIGNIINFTQRMYEPDFFKTGGDAVADFFSRLSRSIFYINGNSRPHPIPLPVRTGTGGQRRGGRRSQLQILFRSYFFAIFIFCGNNYFIPTSYKLLIIDD